KARNARFAAGVFVWVCAALLSGCASLWPQTAQLREGLPPGLPERVELTQVPFFPQSEYQCGPAALAIVLASFGAKVTPEELVLRSGITERETLPFGIHEFLWKRSGYWAMVAVPPDRIPATADESRWLASIAALERAGAASSARTAYAGFLKRWPGNINAAVG